MGKFTLSLKGRNCKARLLSLTVGAASRGCCHIRSQEQVGKKLTLDLTLTLTEQNPNPSQAQRCVAGSTRCAPRAMSASMRVAAQASAVCDVPAASLRAVRSSAALCAARMSASSRHQVSSTVCIMCFRDSYLTPTSIRGSIHRNPPPVKSRTKP